MDQDAVGRDARLNRYPRGRYQGNRRARNTYQGVNNQYRDVDRSNQPNGHPINASTQSNTTHFRGQHRGNTNIRGHAARSFHREFIRGNFHTAGRGRGYGQRGIHTNAAYTSRRQTQTPQSIPTTIATPSNDQFLTSDSSPDLLQTIGPSLSSIGESPGIYQVRHQSIHSTATSTLVGQLGRMDLINNSESVRSDHFRNNISQEGLQTAYNYSDSVSTLHPFYQSTNVQNSNYQATQFPSQILLDTSAASTELLSISAPENINFSPGQSSQSSPLNYLCAHSTSPESYNLQILTKTLSESVCSMLNSPFGLMYASVLDGLCVPQKDLEEYGYRTTNLTRQELEDKQRCFGCGKVWGKIRKSEAHQKAMAKKSKVPNTQKEKQILHSESKNTILSPNTQEVIRKENEISKSEAKSVLQCRFHPGALVKVYGSKDQVLKPGQIPRYHKVWSCCDSPPLGEPCSGYKNHELREVDIKTLSSQWQIHPTPPVMLVDTVSYRIAVALDCEMGISKTGDSELIRVTLIDYFTTEILIDKLVYPEVPMQHLNTQYSGVTWNMLTTAASTNQCFRGRTAALEEIWKFVGPETIVVAHSGNNDLSSLRWRHSKMVDTYLIDAIPEQDRQRKLKKLEDQQKAADKDKKSQTEKSTAKPTTVLSTQELNGQNPADEADKLDNTNPEDKQETPKKVKGKGPFSLKTLAKSRLGRDIQTGQNGHDSLEDALAARDLAHWQVRKIIEGIGAGGGDMDEERSMK